MSKLMLLKRQELNGIRIAPRWPYRTVTVSEIALTSLQAAQSRLKKDVRLVLMRGFESQDGFKLFIRSLSRNCGSILFRILFPKRAGECNEIFSSNGHDKDGNHVDIGVEVKNVRLKCLPFGVFTPLTWARRIAQKNAQILEEVKSTLVLSGFVIHSNPIEALQIHCDIVTWELS